MTTRSGAIYNAFLAGEKYLSGYTAIGEADAGEVVAVELAYAGGVAEDATTGFTIGGPVGAAIGAAAGIAIGSIAYLLASYAPSGGGSAPGKIVPYFPAAQTLYFGEDTDPGDEQRREADDRPNLRLRHGKLTRAKAPPDISAYFNRNANLNYLVDWDGYYVKHWNREYAGTAATMVDIGRWQKFQKAYDDKGGIYIPEILAVKYWAYTSASAAVPWFGIGPGLKNSATGIIRDTDSSTVNDAMMADPVWRDRMGVHCVTRLDLDMGPQAVVDCRNTNGDGILWPLSTFQPFSSTTIVPNVSILYCYRKVDWYTLMELNFQWLLIDQNLQALYGTGPGDGMTAEIVGRQNMLEYLAWYAFYLGVR